MTRKFKAIEITKTNLVEAYWGIYRKDPQNRISVREVVERAGYNRSTFYEYFNGIEDVLPSIEEQLTARIAATLSEGLASDASETSVAAEMAEIYDGESDYLSLLLGPSGDPAFAEMLKTAIRPLLFKSFLLDENDPVDIYTFEFAFGAITGVMTTWFARGKDLEAKAFVALIQDMLMHGVAKRIIG